MKGRHSLRSSRRARMLALLSLLAVAASGAAAAPREGPDRLSRLQQYVDAVKARLDAPAAPALDRIDGVARKLLAARAYLRAGQSLAQRWSWDDAQVQAFAGSVEQQALLAEVAVVRTSFERLYPGYTLTINERIRSLDQQFEEWNRNESVAASAADLATWFGAFLDASGWPTANDEATARTLADALLAYIPQPAPPLAAPGLSAHGRGRAVDFRVYAGDVEVAGPEMAQIATVWDGPLNWSGRLQYAMRQSRARFKGPLITPREPWHYEYTP